MRDHKEIYYRPHKAGLASQCPSSMLRNPNFIPKSEVGVRADLGSASHQAFHTHITKGLKLEDENIAEIARAHNVEVDGYNGLTWRVRKLEKAYAKLLEKGYMNAPTTEEEWPTSLSNGYQYRCFPDAYELQAPYATVLELKMGEVDTGWTQQARDYALALFKKFKDLNLDYVYSIVFAPVADYYNVKVYTREDMLRLEEKLVADMEKTGEQYVTGSLCQWCDNLLNCPAIKRQIDPISRDIMNAGGSQEVSGADIRKWCGVIKGMKKIVEAYEEAERVVLEKEGTIDLGDGTELFFREQFKKQIDAGKAMTVLCDQYGVDKQSFINELSIKTSAIEALSATTAPPQGKAKQVRAIWLALEEEGAMVKKLEKRRATRPITKIRGDK